MGEHPNQIIKVNTDSWVDKAGQLIYRKTIRQMRSLSKGGWFAFEEEVQNAGSDEGIENIRDLKDGLYKLICHYETDEYGNVDGINYSYEPFTEQLEENHE